ncbi:MAG: DUF4340 domain-containing protein [Spirochaetes bacterium]|nr:DUF4340 domain-containing protein [Spirochaetota bacterium]
MKKNHLYLISGILLSAILIFSFFLFINHTGLPEVGCFAGTVNRIEITSGNDKISILKNNELWLINKNMYLADSGLVNRIISALNTFTLTDKLSQDEIAADVNSPGCNFRIRLFSDDLILRDVNLIRKPESVNETYVIFGDSEKIKGCFSAEGISAADFSLNPQDYREKKILTILPEIIERVDASVNLNTYSIEKVTVNDSGTVWRDKMLHKKLDTSAVDSLLNGFLNVTASGFHEGEITGRQVAFYKIFAGNNIISFHIYEADANNDYLCSTSESPYDFYWSAEYASNVLKTFSDLIERKE